MTARQVKASFAAHAQKPLHVTINEVIAAQKKRFKKHPEEAREFMVRAGVLTPTGRWTKPYRMMIKRDLEEQAPVNAVE